MPQFDISTFPSQIFWLFVSFALLYLIIATIALPVLREVLHDRRFKISDNLDNAEKFRKEAEEIYSKINEDIKSAKLNCAQIIEEAKIDVAKKTEQANLNLENKLKEQKKDSEARIASIREDVEVQMNDVVSDIFSQAANKFTGVHISSDQIKSKLN